MDNINLDSNDMLNQMHSGTFNAISVPKSYNVPMGTSADVLGVSDLMHADIQHSSGSINSIPAPDISQLASAASEQHQGVLTTVNPEGGVKSDNFDYEGRCSTYIAGRPHIDITEYLNMPQAEAAKKLGIPTSTLSKRWKEASCKRKWPWRTVCKIDKEIAVLLQNVPQGGTRLPEDIETRLGHLLRKRQDELRTVVIRF